MNKVAKLGIGAVATLVLLELTLQVGALALWLAEPRTEPTGAADRAEHVVLCVGDSYTYGIGTTAQEFTYPNQLERELQSDGADWRVFAAALPGRNSREVLERIDGQLSHFRPHVVCVLVGLNDRWSQPDHLDLDARPEAAVRLHKTAEFHWRWRTARAVRWALGKLAPAPAPPDRATDAEARISRALRQGAPEDAEARVAQLQRELELTPSAEVAEALVVALATLGDGEECLRQARSGVEHWPESAVLWHHLAWQSYQEDDLDSATHGIEEAYRLSSGAPLQKRWSILWHRGVIWMRRDPARSLRTAIELYLAEEKPANFRGLVNYEPGAIDASVLERVLTELGLPREVEARIRELFAGATSWESTDVAEIHASHLRQVVEHCRAAGAQVVLLTYPRPLLYVDDTTRALAQSTGVTRVDLAPEFTRRKREEPGVEYFVPDGHCNDAGYGIVARLVARVIRGLR